MTRRRIPQFRLVAEPVEAGAIGIGFEWADPEVGRRHQLGGEPTVVQYVHWPKCGSCEAEMTFFGQLDAPGDEYALADCGLIQVFVCYDCFETNARLVSS